MGRMPMNASRGRGKRGTRALGLSANDDFDDGEDDDGKDDDGANNH